MQREGGDFLLLPIADTYPDCVRTEEGEKGGGGGGGNVRGQLTDGTWETKLVLRQRLTKRGGSDKNVSGLKLSGTLPKTEWPPQKMVGPHCAIGLAIMVLPNLREIFHNLQPLLNRKMNHKIFVGQI